MTSWKALRLEKERLEGQVKLYRESADSWRKEAEKVKAPIPWNGAINCPTCNGTGSCSKALGLAFKKWLGVTDE